MSSKPIAFDTTQITSAATYSRPQPGDPCHPLAAGAHPPAIAFSCKDSGADAGHIAPTLRSMNETNGNANAGGQVAVAFAQNQRDEVRLMEVAGALASEPGMKQQTYVAQAFESRVARNGRGAPSDIVPPLKAQSGETGKGDAAPLMFTAMQVRRLTPRECERLQGFPDDYTLIPHRGKPAADGPRYKALGNSMAVPCMKWIGERIAMVQRLTDEAAVTTIRENDAHG